MRSGPNRSVTGRKSFFENVRRVARQIMGTAVPRVIELDVHLAYDDDAAMWYVAASDIPGLCLEAENPQRLIERISECASELIKLNQEELQWQHASRDKPRVAVRPVFDSPLQLAHA